MTPNNPYRPRQTGGFNPSNQTFDDTTYGQQQRASSTNRRLPSIAEQERSSLYAPGNHPHTAGVSGGSLSAINRFYENYTGPQRDMAVHFDANKPLFAAALANNPNYQSLQNYQQYSDVMQTMGQASGQFAQQNQQGLTEAQNQLGRMGLSRSAGQGALAQQAAANQGQVDSGLFSSLYQQQLQNRMAGAAQAYNLTSALTAMALGYEGTYIPEGMPEWARNQALNAQTWDAYASL